MNKQIFQKITRIFGTKNLGMRYRVPPLTSTLTAAYHSAYRPAYHDPLKSPLRRANRPEHATGHPRKIASQRPACSFPAF